MLGGPIPIPQLLVAVWQFSVQLHKEWLPEKNRQKHEADSFVQTTP